MSANTVPILKQRYVSERDGCWEWTGTVYPAGYSKAKLNAKTVLGHRAFYEFFVGPIPDGMQIDHLCRNRKCVNPSHLEPVTPKENVHRSLSPAAVNARKVVCLRGHALAGDNLWIDSNGSRICRTCQRLRDSRAKKGGASCQ